MLCFVVVMQSFIMNSHEVFIHIHQGCFAGTGAIVRLPQCQWSRPDGYGKISQCITTIKHSKAKTVCIFLGYTVLRKLFTWMPLYNLNFQFVMEYMVMPFASKYRNTHPIHHIYIYLLLCNLQHYKPMIRRNISNFILNNQQQAHCQQNIYSIQ